MGPPDQRLRADDATGLQLHDGLVIQLQFAIRDCRTQLRGNLQTFPGGVMHVGPKDLDVSAPTGFRRVHRGVGVPQQIVGALPTQAETQADTGPRPDSPVADGQRALQLLERPFGHPQRVVFGGVRHQDGEFIPTPASDGVGLPDNAGDPASHLDQDLVAGAVPEAVVDRLELVEIEDQHARWARTAIGAGHRLPNPVAQQGSIRQAGQRVVERQPFQLDPRLIEGEASVRPPGLPAFDRYDPTRRRAS